MNICLWESSVQSGCHICSQSIKNNNVSMIQSVVCNCFNKKEFLHKYMTMDETWIYLFNLKSTQKSAELTGSRLKLSKVTKDANISRQGFGLRILFIDYLEKGRTINSEYYIALLVCLKEEITKKWPQLSNKKCSFTKTMHHVTSRSQRWQNYMHFELLPHPPYSPDLAPVTTGCLQTIFKPFSTKFWICKIMLWVRHFKG